MRTATAAGDGGLTWKRKRAKGTTAKTHREWIDTSGSYLIVWRCEAFGVKVPAEFHAFLLYGERRLFFGGRPRAFKKLATAQAACEHHNKTGE